MNTAPLQGITVIDFTEVQSGPSCTQMMAWLGANVIKIERPGKGDATRSELQFDPKLPSYYYLQLNSDKKSVTLDAKTPDGKAILTKMLSTADVFIENLHPGAMDKLGFGWDAVHKLNPKLIYGTIKGFPQGSPYESYKAYEPIAQCMGGGASTTGWYDGQYNVPTQSGAALGDSNTGMHLLIGVLAALLQRQKTGEGCYVYQSMTNACLNLCRIKLRDQLNLEKLGYLTQFPQYPNEKFPDYVPRSGNIEGGGVLGWTYPCSNYQNDENDYVYIILQREPKNFEIFCKAIGFEDWLTNPDFNTADARDRNKQAIWKRVGEWTVQRTAAEVMNTLGSVGVPCAPILNMKQIAEDPSNRANQSIVEINQGGGVGTFLTVGCPMTFSNYTPNYGPAPELGADTATVLAGYGYTPEQIAQFKTNGTTEPMPKAATPAPEPVAAK